MAKVISIALQKGGTGKTTTALCLASTLAYKKKRVLLVDMDSQGNSTYTTGAEVEYSVVDVISGTCEPSEATIRCNGNFDLLAADERLVNLEHITELESTLLKNILEQISDKYDYIIIDTPPALGNLLKNSLMASDGVIIPLEPRPFSLQGLTALQETIESVQAENKALKVLGILLIKYSNRTVLNRTIKDLLDQYAEQLNTTVFTTTIREGIAVAESQAYQKPLIEYAPSSKPNIDYKAFTTELLKRLESK